MIDPKTKFRELISPYLRMRLQELEAQYGKDSPQYRGIAKQYIFDPEEVTSTAERNQRHYLASVEVDAGKKLLIQGVERLYRRTVLIEPTTACAAHCRYCLRRGYKAQTLSERALEDIAVYCGNEQNRHEVREVLVTGGDPLIMTRRLKFLIESLVRYAPNVEIIRIGTRIPVQNPHRVDQNVLSVFENKGNLRFEVGIQINHPEELTQETRAAIKRIEEGGVRFYAQNVLLKGVNDELETLIVLYDNLRYMGIEAHYLFHAIPMKNTHYFRTSLKKGMSLISSLTSCGMASGRAKPMFSAMTDVGKVILYEGSIIDRDPDNNRVLLQTHYNHEQRVSWNPNWKLPDSAEIDENGLIRVWYLDGLDD